MVYLHFNIIGTVSITASHENSWMDFNYIWSCLTWSNLKYMLCSTLEIYLGSPQRAGQPSSRALTGLVRGPCDIHVTHVKMSWID